MSKSINEELMKNGEEISKIEYIEGINKICLCKMKYNGILYHVRYINGVIKKAIQWDNLAYQEKKEDIKNLSEEELMDLFMLSCRDKGTNPEAERVYWLCIHEINTKYSEEIKQMEKEMVM